MSADLIELVRRLGQPRILVVGDVMLDRYVWGDAERISQEAPVILLHADKREERLGGASSVATMLRALGARVALAGVVGADFDGGRLRQQLTDLDIDHDAVLVDPDRPTTVKERYIGRAQHRHPQQMIRVDYETRQPISATLEGQLHAIITQQMRKADMVLVSDYDKGVCTPKVLEGALAAARSLGLRSLADPIRGKDYSKYHGCSAMTPNRLEAGLATGLSLHTSAEALEAESRRRLGQRLAFTNGCFDVLHAGHVHYLQEARAQADLLVVGLNSDASVRALKGPDRPVNSEEARALLLAALQAVDYVSVFEESTPLALIQALRPDVLVKGADYRKEDVVGAALVEAYGGRVHLAQFHEGYSTTRTLQKLGAA